MAMLIRLPAFRLRVNRLCVFSTRIRLNSTNTQTTDLKLGDMDLSPITSISDGLKKYIRWFPYDTVTYSTIQSYLKLRRNTTRSDTILVGLLYESEEVRNSSRVLESLLADPLSANNEDWFRPLAERSREKNNMITFDGLESSESLLPGAFERTIETFTLPSPMLSQSLRQSYPEIFPPLETVANDLAILEVNKSSDAEKLTDNCQFFIYVTNEYSTLMDKLPRPVQKKIMLTVIDNTEFSPQSSELTPVTFERSGPLVHHSIKINSSLAYSGINLFLENDVSAATEYFASLQKSNIIEFKKFLLWYLRTENLTSWMFHVICTEIARNDLTETKLQQIYSDLKLETLAKCSSSMHGELQKSLIPETNKFFSRKLRWWMLYWKNDNVEYSLKDYFLANFMPKSIESYNYVRGQLTARLQEQKYAAYSDKIGVINPLKAFKRDLINERIPNELQPVVYHCLATAFVYYQLPLTVLSVCGYLFVGLEPDTAFAIGLLGWVLGFNHVSREWHKFTTQWLKNLYEQVRIVITRGCVAEGLLKELDARYEENRMLAKVKKQVLKELTKHQ